MKKCSFLIKINEKWFCSNEQPVECLFDELMACKATTKIDNKKKIKINLI